MKVIGKRRRNGPKVSEKTQVLKTRLVKERKERQEREKKKRRQ
jgi:hypothetical protein